MHEKRQGPRRSVTRRASVWFAGSALGAGLIALPDSGARVFSLSSAHGPSAVDLLGMVVVVAAWLPVVHLLWSWRALLTGPVGRALLAVGVVGLAALVVTIRLDLAELWLVAVALLTVAQVGALVHVWRMSGPVPAHRG